MCVCVCSQTGPEYRKIEPWSLKWPATEDKKAEKQRSIGTLAILARHRFSFFLLLHSGTVCREGEVGGALG